MRIKVIFIIPSLRSGGAERVMSFLAQNLNKEQFNPILLVVGHNENVAYDVKDTNVFFLKKDKVSNAIPKIIRFFYDQKPQIVISAIAHLNMAMALISPLFPNTKFVGRETIVASKSTKQKSRSLVSTILFKLKPKLLDCIVCQSKDMREDLLNNYNYPAHKLHIINNPVTSKFRLKDSFNNNSKFELITVGRLTKQKGYSRILIALSKINVDFHYTIIGNGPLYEVVMNDIHKYKLADKVKHIPYTNKVETFLSKSDLFLSGSYVEGFPNAILESCAVGTPVLAFAAEGGIDEIIKPGINGEIAFNDKDFLEKLKFCIAKKWEPSVIRESVTKLYSEDIILFKYQELFLKLKNS
ncbi:glycosyltransferase [Zobellia sp. 1_MG-2023]|uniref:glycosyltransferase n=1 Tax=Zobellia sp. 1_MG-2023 TaxID=3062626 RepID=UPI0026E4502D|nr:glycosyltransferase [Zobellia sp. 1_MG-2023]MDO6819739.1 glycosyltransferase [Zobellia sp. 1_MG-2023]